MSAIFPGQYGAPEEFNPLAGMSPNTNDNNAGWVNGNFPGQTPYSPYMGPSGTQGTTPPATNPNAPRNPMDYFRNDVDGYNRYQFANTAGQNYLQGLMPGIQFGQTNAQGPVTPPQQSVFNVGGQGANYNTGLNIANSLQYSGDDSLKSLFDRMVADERKFNAGSQMAGNDASVLGYTGYQGTPYQAGSLVAGSTPNTYNPANYTSPQALAQGAAANNAAANTAANQTPTTAQPQTQTQTQSNNFLQQLLPLLLLSGFAGGNGGGGLQQLLMLSMLGGGGSGLAGLFGGSQGNGNTTSNRNPYLYGLTY